MKKHLLFSAVVLLAAAAGIANAVPWDSATATIPEDQTTERAVITSITAGGHTFDAADLYFGVSSGGTGVYDGGSAHPEEPLSVPGGQDNPNGLDDLYTYTELYNSSLFTTDLTVFGGSYSNQNGALVDFFLGESNGNDDVSITSVYSLDGGATTATGLSLDFSSGDQSAEPAGDYGDTGHAIAYGGQNLKGFAWSIEDMLDGAGENLPDTAEIMSITIDAGGLDAQVMAVHLPEPATMSLLALGSLAMFRRRKA
jgi:hypothetical protein